MTLIAIAAHQDHAEILVDHFMMGTDYGRHTGTIGKLLTLPHLDAVVAMQGDQPFFAEWAYALSLTAGLTDFDSLVEFVTANTATVWEHRWSKSPDAEPYPTTCYLLGASAAEGRYRAIALSSDHGFDPVDLADDLFVFPAPHSDMPATPSTIEEWRDLACLVHAERSLDIYGTARKVPTGGRLVLTRLEDGAISQTTIGEFAQNGPQFHRMMYGFNHPSSQLATCPCDSGALLIECCETDHATEPCECGSGMAFGQCCRVDPTITGDQPCPCGRGLVVADCCAPHIARRPDTLKVLADICDRELATLECAGLIPLAADRP